ncbi:hypothetical protein [Marinobacter xestospongiae]|uniref:hypothetical protein n=1 Tax=Marinobacter xestospongiae TaxID=994319 RepID=UPI002005C475|nr:hypothetical protein [Marinobacter xestospongiae]MCK7569137.1 hypothetical protein [Marinobacter xestospongiae]
MSETIPELFIIESLTLDDEDNHRQEGEILSRMLRLAGKAKTKYFYIRTKRELEQIINIFDESKYRYLHLSCHANDSEMGTTFDDVSFRQLGEMLAPCLDKRRVFVSACEMANSKLAKQLLPGSGCYSLIGPARDINFDDAAAFWVSFYHLMFRANERGMGRKDLKWCITELAALYGEPVNYFAASGSAKQGLKRVPSRKI